MGKVNIPLFQKSVASVLKPKRTAIGVAGIPISQSPRTEHKIGFALNHVDFYQQPRDDVPAEPTAHENLIRLDALESVSGALVFL